MTYDIEPILHRLVKVSPYQTHDEAVGEIERIFREFKFFTTREYKIFSMKDGSGRTGRIDLIARKGKFRVAVEYDHKYNVKFKSFQKITQIKPEVAIAITGLGQLNESVKRAEKYKTVVPLYVISLREGRYKLVTDQTDKPI
jgi:hypothetical protein